MSDNSSETEKNALIRRYTDLLATQTDAEALQLIDDLETLYTSARVPEQLALAPAFPRHANARQTPEQSIAPGMPTVSSPKRGSRWINRLNAIAAVLIAASLVSSLLIVTHMAQRPQQGNGSGITNAPQCVIPQAQAHKSTAWLFSLHMINETTGWAQGVDHITEQNRILHTTDGGTTWQDVTPPLDVKAANATQQAAYAGGPYYLNACVAWVALAQPQGAPALLFRTGDGGLTWQQSALPGSDIGGIDFIDARVGWLTVDVLKNGKFSEEDFYHSVDGGQHWIMIAVSRPATDNQPGALPFANAVNNFTFINANTGWITGGSNVAAGPRLYITHDGGRTWHQQLLPPPGNGDTRIFKSGTVVWRPQFFSAREGILPVSFWAANSLTVYATHDGGNSWQSTSMLRIPMPPNLDTFAPTPEPDFVDVNHGWASGWQGTPLLYVTGDGGKHWTKIVPQPNVQYIALYNYDFVTSKTGRALGAITHSTPGPVAPLLFKTEDGGKTWTYVRGA